MGYKYSIHNNNIIKGTGQCLCPDCRINRLKEDKMKQPSKENVLKAYEKADCEESAKILEALYPDILPPKPKKVCITGTVKFETGARDIDGIFVGIRYGEELIGLINDDGVEMFSDSYDYDLTTNLRNWEFYKYD